MEQIKCSTCKECNDCGNFNIWKDTMATLSLSLFLMIDLKNESYIIHLENYELYHRLPTLGVWQCTYLTRWDKVQILGLQYFNTILKKCSMTEYLSFNPKK